MDKSNSNTSNANSSDLDVLSMLTDNVGKGTTLPQSNSLETANLSNMADNCTQFYLHLSACMKPQYQFSRYHRTGEMEYCPAHFEDLVTCTRAKFTPGREKKEKLMMETSFYKQQAEQNLRKAPWVAKKVAQWSSD
jgi:hypothetical protein